jgi:mannose/cellobiose epimerase-like protein (N-acyl-D-glucosamine 2-epimerase family)
MKRRSFLTITAGTMAAFYGAGCRIEKIHPVSRPIENLRIADRTLEELREQYRYDLFDDFLPFADRYVIDHELGGFMCGVDRDGSRLSSEKRASWEGQGLWMFSFLFNRVAQDRQYLEIALKSLTFLRKNKPVGENLWPENYTREGQPSGRADSRGLSELFIADGLYEFAVASGEERWKELAKEILLKVVRLYDRPDYSPSYCQEFLGPRAPLLPGARVQGVWMQLIGVASRMLEKQPDPDIEEILNRSIAAVMRFHYNPDFRLHNEILNHDLSRPANEYNQLVHTGNSIETLRVLLFEAARIKNRELFDTVTERFRRHIETAWDSIYGGLYLSLSNVQRNEWDMAKVLRVQEEALIGLLFLIEHTGARWAMDLFGKVYAYVRERFTMKQYGYPLWILAADRRVSFEPHSNRVDIFYHPRHLMLNLLSLDRMISRGGKVSNLFGE